MRPLAVGVAVSGLLFVTVTLLMLPVGPADRPQPETAEVGTTVVGQEAAGRQPVLRTSRVRPVAPELSALPQIDQATLERVDARSAPAPAARAPARHDEALKEKLLYRPLATGAGAFRAQGYRVRLAGLVPTDAEETCGSGIDAWPCGIHARTAFRNWLRGRALTCMVPPPATEEESVVAECRLGNQDPAEWLVAQGWARATEDGPFAALGAAAQQEGRGLFGTAPVATLPVTSAPSETSGG